jgi:hypothetical protein
MRFFARREGRLFLGIGVFSLVAAVAAGGYGRPRAAVADDGVSATSQGPVVANVPSAWTPPRGQRTTTDFALAAQADAWLRHVVLGDPSFDNFQHAAANPMLRGKKPFEWPVNGSLFEDPKSHGWYAYVGHYAANYDFAPGKPQSHCTVYRTLDQGKTWDDLGPIFRDASFRFAGGMRPESAPDVSVVFDGGRYHMAYDWASDKCTWQNICNPTDDADNGSAYAWADRPEGPFHRESPPIFTTGRLQKQFPLAWKYNRAYATTLIRRSHDWLAMVLVDSGQYYSWGLLAVTAPTPQGPWSQPTLILSVEGNRYFPPWLEFFPGFVHEGFVYCPATSIASNRNFQAIYRAKVEQAHTPEAWQLDQHGTAWHAENVPHEGLGIWGQTFSGFVDSAGVFHVLFPCRERVSGLGTINLASRPWNKPLADRGFVLSGHEGGSLTLLRSAYRGFDLTAKLTMHGNAARIVWGCQAPLGPDRHSSGATIHPLTNTQRQQLELSKQQWQLVSVDDRGKNAVTASGVLSAGASHVVKMTLRDDGQAELILDGDNAWKGRLPVVQGPIGLSVDPATHLKVEQFSVGGVSNPAVFSYLYTDALAATGTKMADWDVVQSPDFRFGVGAVRKAADGRAKWNFHGSGFRLWLPKGPQYGRCNVLLDGVKLAELDLHNEKSQPSQIVLSRDDLPNAYHALVVRPIEGRFAVDSLDAVN